MQKAIISAENCKIFSNSLNELNWGKRLVRNTWANGILLNKSNKHNWFLKGPQYQENY